MSGLYDVLVVGAGPTGLACGIEAVRAGLSLLMIEKGCLVNSLFTYPPGMTFFTSRERLEIGELPLPSVNVKPTRAEALEYYRRVAETYRLPIHYQERVVTVEAPDAVFRVVTEDAHSRTKSYTARYVIIATGYYDIPILLNIPGEELPIVSHYYTEAHAFYQRKVAVIGAANSAAVAALDLWRHGAEVTLIHREPELSRHIKYWIKPDLENRIKENSIQALFQTEVKEIHRDWICVQRNGGTGSLPHGAGVSPVSSDGQDGHATTGETLRVANDFVFALTGYRPDFEFLESAGVRVDPKTRKPACNPESLESNVPGLYLAGVIIAGTHTNEIFIENGRFHGKQIIADISRKTQGGVQAGALASPAS
jgi:thioredoxin reductase (NADPH)